MNEFRRSFCEIAAYEALVQQPLPNESSPDYIPSLLYKARSYIALNKPQSALEIIPTDPDNVALKAVSSLARFVAASDAAESETALEELRDLSVEIEGDDAEGSEKDKSLVKVLAGTAFARVGEIEEALETLGSETEDLEAYVVTFYTDLTSSITRFFRSEGLPLLCRYTFL